MWAQLVKTRVKPGHEREVEELQLKLEERSNPAWIRSMTFANPDNPREHYNLVFFESEELARHHERHPEQHAMIMQLMECYEEPPEFTDLELIHEAGR